MTAKIQFLNGVEAMIAEDERTSLKHVLTQKRPQGSHRAATVITISKELIARGTRPTRHHVYAIRSTWDYLGRGKWQRVSRQLLALPRRRLWHPIVISSFAA